MKYLNMFDGQLWLWKTETGESVIEFMASYKDGMEKIVVAGDGLVKSLLDMGLISGAMRVYREMGLISGAMRVYREVESDEDA